MSNNTPSLLQELFANSDSSTRKSIKPLQEIVIENPVYADTVFDALHAGLQRVIKEGGSGTGLANAIVVLAPRHPDLASQLVEPVSRLTMHQNDTLRREGFRCLGVLGAVASTNTSRITEVVTSGISDTGRGVRAAALWSMTKIGLANPETTFAAETELREQLNTPIAPDKYDRIGNKIRAYAAEAIAVSYADTHGVGQQPSGRPLKEDTPEAFAAWAIKQAADAIDLRAPDRDQVFGITDPQEDHQLCCRLVPQLQRQADSGAQDLAVASVLALGYLVPGEGRFQESLGFLHELIEDDHGRKAHAANWILEHGPFSPTDTIQVDESLECAVELTVADPSSTLMDQGIGLPYDIYKSFDAGTSAPWNAVEMHGENRFIASVQMRHQQDGTLYANDWCRHNLGVTIGDTVDIRPVTAKRARKAVLTLPEGIPTDTTTLQSETVKRHLAKQSFTVGDCLGIDVILSDDQLTEIEQLDIDHRTGLAHEKIVEEELTSCETLPLEVTSVVPNKAMTLGVNTVLAFQSDPSIGEDWDATTDITASTTAVPACVVKSPHRDRGHATPDALMMSEEEKEMIRDRTS